MDSVWGDFVVTGRSSGVGNGGIALDAGKRAAIEVDERRFGTGRAEVDEQVGCHGRSLFRVFADKPIFEVLRIFLWIAFFRIAPAATARRLG